MTNFRATHKQTSEVVEYVQALPDQEHLTDDPRMVALTQLEAFGVLGTGRAQEILNG